ncbi:MAG TPA: hypothetical protein VD993_05595 [Chitinophagaceae bacterium]|nr:hypothetical protein [Chitinophagaceae bacterium]
MKVQLAHILQSLFHTTELDQVPVHRLQEMIREHPYFNAAHLLLAQKLKHQHPEEYEAQVQKAAIYFHDPLWMHWQLNQQDGVVATPATPQETAVVIQREVETTETDDEEYIAVSDNETNVDEVVENETGIEEPVYEGFATTPAEIETRETESEPGSTEAVERMEADMPEIELTAPPTADTETAEPAITESEITPDAEPSQIASPVASPEPITAEIQHTGSIEPRPAGPVSHDNGVDNAERTREKEPIAFDPYYTIDYFAYQGIKAPTDVQPGDKLGKQLKSFTEWLKTMKRLPQTDIDARTSEAEQQDIQRFAAGSLQQTRVFTESMAEVLVKQDRKREAIMVYEKLSLLDPSKSAYFAAKIENLKRELI